MVSLLDVPLNLDSLMMTPMGIDEYAEKTSALDN